MQTEGAAESSGEESSGEESSGEEDEGAAGEPAPEAVKEEDDRLEGESKASRDKRVYAEKMRIARADRQETQVASDEALRVNNADIARQQVRPVLLSLARYPHLLAPAEPALSLSCLQFTAPYFRQAEMAKKRMSFLMKQADVFSKFLGVDFVK